MRNQCIICSAEGGDDLFEKLESGNLRKTCRRCRREQNRQRKRKPVRFCGCGEPLRKGKSLCPACKKRNIRERERIQRRKKTDLRWAGREDELAQLRDIQLNGAGPTKVCAGCGVEYPRDQKHFPKAASRNWTYCRECTNKKKRAYKKTRTKRAATHTVQVPPTHQVCRRCFRLLPKTKAFFKPRSDRDALYSRCWSCYSVSNAERTKMRTPRWLSAADWGEITAIYRKARAMKAASGIQYEVDHIEPLKGVDRCGLHVPWNLRIVTREQNVANWREHLRKAS